jgi:hypothetical protein
VLTATFAAAFSTLAPRFLLFVQPFLGIGRLSRIRSLH